MHSLEIIVAENVRAAARAAARAASQGDYDLRDSIVYATICDHRCSPRVVALFLDTYSEERQR